MKKILAAIISLILIFTSLCPALAWELPSEEPAEETAQFKEEEPSSEALQSETSQPEASQPEASQPDEPSSEAETEAETSQSETSQSETSQSGGDADTLFSFDVSCEWINLYIDNTLTLTKNRVVSIGGALFLPAEETALLLSLGVSHVPFSDTITALCVSRGERSAYLFENSYYAIINSEALDMPVPCYVVDGVLYAPLSVFTQVFGVECVIASSGPDPDLFLTSFGSEAGDSYAERVNSLRLKSDTDYLIWVSKGDYSVRLFRRAASKWVFDREFPCAIGAPKTPTCEGVYKFYERVAAWRYDTYYVGPIMRFNGGYALHSTLINYDGSMKNDRVGVKISHGCVRLHPEDINYLYKTVPLYTTVYISAD